MKKTVSKSQYVYNKHVRATKTVKTVCLDRTKTKVDGEGGGSDPSPLFHGRANAVSVYFVGYCLIFLKFHKLFYYSVTLCFVFLFRTRLKWPIHKTLQYNFEITLFFCQQRTHHPEPPSPLILESETKKGKAKGCLIKFKVC